ncbi:ABC transporter substrate-binding protein [Paenibacillus tarimensis]
MKKRVKTTSLMLLVFAMMTALLIGCSGGSGSNTPAAPANNGTADSQNSQNTTPDPAPSAPEPITLRISSYSWEDFDRVFKNPIEAKFPHITVEKVDVEPSTLAELVARGEEVPDIIWYGGPADLHHAQKLGLALDLNPLIERHGFDLSIFKPELVESMRGFSGGDELHALARQAAPYALHYNKNIFDLFGVDYPTDGMTWEDAIELAKKVSGEKDGVKYYGLHPAIHSRILYESTILDPETHEPRLTSDPFFKEYLETFQAMYSVPGNLPPVNEESGNMENGHAMFRGGQLAMLPLWPEVAWAASNETFETDLVTLPTFASYPGQQPESMSHSLGLTTTSKHQDEAFKVLTFMISEEYLLDVFASFESPARLPFSDPAIIEKFQLDPKYDGMNIDAYSKLPFSPGPGPRSKYEIAIAYPVITSMINEIALSGKDVNQVLREAEELAKSKVAELKAAE